MGLADEFCQVPREVGVPPDLRHAGGGVLDGCAAQCAAALHLREHPAASRAVRPQGLPAAPLPHHPLRHVHDHVASGGGVPRPGLAHHRGHRHEHGVPRIIRVLHLLAAPLHGCAATAAAMDGAPARVAHAVYLRRADHSDVHHRLRLGHADHHVFGGGGDGVRPLDIMVALRFAAQQGGAEALVRLEGRLQHGGHAGAWILPRAQGRFPAHLHRARRLRRPRLLAREVSSPLRRNTGAEGTQPSTKLTMRLSPPASTVPLGFLNYSFLVDDAAYEMRRAEAALRKEKAKQLKKES
mmetsp:Transcript_46707/g.145856  ORF Transcript_46707/g.145856 Transcript_46707/m.145856 type:complete len:296 (-) Transcript_46707:667-1554(-)